MYRTMNDGSIQRVSDLAIFEPNEDNPSYRQHLKDKAAGATESPFDYAAEDARQAAAQAIVDVKKAREALDQTERNQAKLDTATMALVNATPAQLVTYARANFPSLTLAEQNKMGFLLNIVATAVRPHIRNGG